MNLSPGTRLGPYEILSPLGAGGMGEVYRARDTRLGREVAVKVLPEHLSSNPEVRARFEREAKTVSSLNHPHICVLHDLGRDRDIDYLVMELVDGETLASRLTKGALPTADVLRIGSQIADALERAHRAGVVHRDLKPGNVMVTKAGAKLMDFGLARAVGLGGETGSGVTVASLSHSPTIAHPLTAEGTLVGTFQYMAPEQLEGKEADARSDIWALGCVIYEMATGVRAFEGKSQASLISSIMSSEPRPVSQVASLSPPALDRLVSQCLAKDPDERFQSAHDVRLSLQTLRDASGIVEAPAVGKRNRRTTWPMVVAALATGLAIGVLAARWITPAGHVDPPRVSILSHSGADQQPVASPDGKTIAFASARTGRSQIWIKQLTSGDEVALTDGEDFSPQFSADGSQVLYVHNDGGVGGLWRVSIVGGQPRRLAERATGGAWSPDGKRLAFLRTNTEDDRSGELWLANADGSEPHVFYTHRAGALRWVTWSPDGSQLMVGSVPLANAATYFYVVPANGDSIRQVTSAAGLALTSNPVWLTNDRIAYSIVEALATTVTGQASRVVEQSLRDGTTRELLSIPNACYNLDVLGDGRLLMGLAQQSQNLILVEKAGTPDARQTWLTRGASTDRQPCFSPDATRILFSSNRSGNLDVWEMEVASGALTRLTDDVADDWDPAYSPDGAHIWWSSNRSGVFEVWEANADGSGAHQVSRDGVDAENPTLADGSEWVLYLGGRDGLPGAWKMRRDGSDAVSIVQGVNLPDFSPAGDVFAAPLGAGQRTGRVLRVYRVSDGTPWSWEAALPVSPDLNVGRPRWAGPRRLAYTNRDELGRFGVVIRDVTETSGGTVRKLAGFDPLWPTESFDVADNGARVALSVRSAVFSIAVAENVKGVKVAP